VEVNESPAHHRTGNIRLPLYQQVLIAVACGGLLGVLFGQDSYLGGLRNEQLGKLGLIVVSILKTLAIPLIFFAIIDALIRTTIPLRQGGKLLAICFVNVTIAMTIGLSIMNSWQPGLLWYGHVDDLLRIVPEAKTAPTYTSSDHPLQDLAAYIPRTIAEPFSSHNIIGVVLLALVVGVVIRALYHKSAQAGGAIDWVVQAIQRIYGWLVKILGWIILIVPIAVFGIVAQVVGKSGLGVFSVLWIFLVAMLAGLAIHSLIYYPSSGKNRLRSMSGREPTRS